MQAPEPLPDAGSVPGWLPRSGHFAALLLIAGLAIMMFWRPASLAEGDRQSLATALSVLVNQRVTYPEGGIPFDRERLLQLRQVVAILSSAGIAADIEMRAHVGEYCRVLVPGAGAALPAGDVPIEACDLIG